jgi:hypothetical protein
MLRKEVRDQGMDDLVSGNGEVLAVKMLDELENTGEETKEMFDPLMRAWFMIENRAMEGIGPAILHPDFGCPLCRISDSRTEDGACKCPNADCPNRAPGSVPNPEEWIKGPDSAVASLKEYASEKGWIKA